MIRKVIYNLLMLFFIMPFHAQKKRDTSVPTKDIDTDSITYYILYDLNQFRKRTD